MLLLRSAACCLLRCMCSLNLLLFLAEWLVMRPLLWGVQTMLLLLLRFSVALLLVLLLGALGASFLASSLRNSSSSSSSSSDASSSRSSSRRRGKTGSGETAGDGQETLKLSRRRASSKISKRSSSSSTSSTSSSRCSSSIREEAGSLAVDILRIATKKSAAGIVASAAAVARHIRWRR